MGETPAKARGPVKLNHARFYGSCSRTANSATVGG